MLQSGAETQIELRDHSSIWVKNSAAQDQDSKQGGGLNRMWACIGESAGFEPQHCRQMTQPQSASAQTGELRRVPTEQGAAQRPARGRGGAP